MVTGAYYVGITYAEQFPAIHGNHEAWRYTLLSGLIPAIPLILTRPFLPESPIWQEMKSNGRLQRPSFAELFRPALRRTTLTTTFLVACSYALASGVIQQTPRMVPRPSRDEGHGAAHGGANREWRAIVSGARYDCWAFVVCLHGGPDHDAEAPPARLSGSRIIVFSCMYFFAATHSLRLLECGILLAGLLLNGPFSLWGNYLPRMYPTHLRGTGESFAINIGGPGDRRVRGAVHDAAHQHHAQRQRDCSAGLLGRHTRGPRLYGVAHRKLLATRTRTGSIAGLTLSAHVRASGSK